MTDQARVTKQAGRITPTGPGHRIAPRPDDATGMDGVRDDAATEPEPELRIRPIL